MGIPVASIAPPSNGSSFREVLGAVLLAPVVETALLALGVSLLSRLFDRPILVAGASAAIWGLLHGIFGTLWFFGTVWSFFVFSCAFLAWRGHSFRAGFVAAAIPHALVNLSAMSMGALDVQ